VFLAGTVVASWLTGYVFIYPKIAPGVAYTRGIHVGVEYYSIPNTYMDTITLIIRSSSVGSCWIRL
jgi:hypothetical protein